MLPSSRYSRGAPSPNTTPSSRHRQTCSTKSLPALSATILWGMLDDTVVADARALVSARAKALGPQVAVHAKQFKGATSEELRDAVGRSSKRDRPFVGLLLARVALEEALNADSLLMLQQFGFRFASHLQASVSDDGATRAGRYALARAAEYLFLNLPDTSNAQRELATRVRSKLEGIVTGDSDWQSVLGLTEAEFHATAHDFVEALPSRKRPVPQPPSPTIVIDPPRLEPTGSPSKGTAPRPDGALAVKFVSMAPPRWLQFERGARGDARLASTANWFSSASGEADPSNEHLLLAWASFTTCDFSAAKGALDPLLLSLNQTWQPSMTADGVPLWNWIRLVVELDVLLSGGSRDRRRSATSAFQLSRRCLPDETDLQGELLELALAGLSGQDPMSAKAWSAYSIRAIRDSDHEYALSVYNNAEKAELRSAWTESHGLDRDRTRSTSEMASELVTNFGAIATRMNLSATGQRTIQQTMQEVRRSVPPYLDQSEQDLFSDALEVFVEGRRVLDADSADHRSAHEVQDTIRSLSSEIATSSSLILQDMLAPNLQRLWEELQVAIERLENTTRPLLAIELVTARLPFSATAGTSFKIRALVANTGNAAAESVTLRLTGHEVGLDTTVGIAQVPAGSESEVEFEATAGGVSPNATTLLCHAEWVDALDRSFESTTSLLAEDQRATSWQPSDVNPFNLGTISDPSRLVGREQDLRTLEAILAGGGSVYVTGQKRVGKTSLVRVLLKQLQSSRGWSGDVLPLGRALGTDQSAGDLVYAMMDTLRNSAVGAYPDSASTLPVIDEDPGGNFSRSANRWLRQIPHVIPAEAHIVLAVDDFDELPPSLREGPEAHSLFLFLRSLVDEPWLNLILIGSEILPAIIQAQDHMLNQVAPISVTNFHARASTESLLCTPTAARLEWDVSAIDRVHSTCKGNPYYETLLGQQIWQDLHDTNRSYVTQGDVDGATASLSRTTSTSHFVHLWADGTGGMDRASRTSVVSSAALRAVARCGGATLVPVSFNELTGVAQAWIPTVQTKEVERAVQVLVARAVLEYLPMQEAYVVAIPLVGHWLNGAGSAALDHYYSESPHAQAMPSVVTNADLTELSRGLIYAGEAVSEIRIKAWLEQFGDNYQQFLAYQMLRRMVKDGYFDSTQLQTKLIPRLATNISQSAAGRSIIKDRNNYLKNGYILQHGVPGDSTQSSISAMRSILKVKKAQILEADALSLAIAKSDSTAVVMVLDDFCGTGSHLERTVGQLKEVLDGRVDGWRDQVEMVVGACVVAEASLLDVGSEDGTSVTSVCALELGARFRAFDPEAGVFASEQERVDALDLVSSIGQSLVKSAPLGYGARALLVLNDYNISNNAPAVFWKAGQYGGRPWTPLFERKM